MPITIPTVAYDGTTPDPVEWANDSVKPAIEELDTRVSAQENAFSVFFEGRADATPNLTLSTFVTFPIDNVLTNDGGGTFNTSNYEYTVPEDGLYDCQATIRISDGSVARSLGVGIHTANNDGAWFLWGQMGGITRDAKQYRRVTRFSAGQNVRLYIYSDGQAFPVTAGSLAIRKVAN